MSIHLACGAECATKAQNNSTADADTHFRWQGGTPTIDTATPRSGARCWSFAAAVTAPTLEHIGPASQTISYLRGYFRLSSVAPSATVTIFTLSMNAGTAPTVTVTTGGVLQFNVGGGAVSGPTLSAATWYGVELEVDVSANPHTGRWRTWDASGGWVTQTAPTNYTNAATTILSTTMGCVGVTSGTTVLVDDLLYGYATVAGTDYDPAVSKGGKVLRYLPNADGAHSFLQNDFRYNAAGTQFAMSATDIYTYLDDDDQTSNADFIAQDVIRSTGYVEIQFADEATETAPRCVGVTSYHQGETNNAHTMSLKVSDDNFTSTTAVWTDYDTSFSAAAMMDLHQVLASKPSGGGWTTAAVNAMKARWGYSTDVLDRPYFHNISLEVEWTEVIGGAATAFIGGGFFP